MTDRLVRIERILESTAQQSQKNSEQIQKNSEQIQKNSEQIQLIFYSLSRSERLMAQTQMELATLTQNMQQQSWDIAKLVEGLKSKGIFD
ncbi:hypothetical protein HC766_00070 [Candidatus Gracilibacteria bacterium]|nr:hypothetical protein [Candidatus Gracilibacteria bacterium]NJS40790.1 hypothetical protein [Candidatus Gracilibacteria bacterium]